MRHHVDGRKLGMKSSHKKAMFANMSASLILHDRIETTLPKAKELRRIADRLVTLGKSQLLSARRRAIAITRNKTAVHKLFNELAKRFESRNGGYTRILKLGWRHGDAAPMAAIEYLNAERKAEKEEGKERTKKEAQAIKETAGHAKKAGQRAHAEKRAAPKAKKFLSAKKPAKRSSPAHRASSKGE